MNFSVVDVDISKRRDQRLQEYELEFERSIAQMKLRFQKDGVKCFALPFTAVFSIFFSGMSRELVFEAHKLYSDQVRSSDRFCFSIVYISINTRFAGCCP